MKHLTEEQLILYEYGEAVDHEEIGQHLALCEQCRAERDALASVLSAADITSAPQRSEDYGAEVWRRLEPRLVRESIQSGGWNPFADGWSALLAPRRWVPAVVAASLIIAAFVAGRFWPRHETPRVPLAVSQQSRDRILLVAVGDHLDRSQMVLVEFMNSPEPGRGKVDISFERARAQQLITANRLYRQTAERMGEAGVASVLDDLERVLMDVAHSPDRISPAEFQGLRKRIEAQGMIFKVRVIDSQVRAREGIASSQLESEM
jgi:hypothetical protein